MAPNGFQVDIQVLHGHASEIRDVKSKVDQVADAGKQVTPGGWDNAYGLICQPFPQGTRPIADQLLTFVRTLSSYYEQTIEKLGQDEDTYHDTENRIVKRMRELQEQLDSAARPPEVSDAPGGGSSSARTDVGDPMPRVTPPPHVPGTGDPMPHVNLPTEGTPR